MLFTPSVSSIPTSTSGSGSPVSEVFFWLARVTPSRRFSRPTSHAVGSTPRSDAHAPISVKESGFSPKPLLVRAPPSSQYHRQTWSRA